MRELTGIVIIALFVATATPEGSAQDSIRVRDPNVASVAGRADKTSWMWLPLKMMAAFDVSGDGRLQRDELVPQADFWMDFDSNQDAALTSLELAIGLWGVQDINKGENQDRASLSEPASSLPRLSRASRSKFGQLRKPSIPKPIAATGQGVQQSKPTDQETTRKFARSLIRTYDTDGDGVLVASEWNEIKGTWDKVDFNSDRRISIDEMVVRYRSLQNDSFSKRQSATGRRARLPVDLPEEFFDLDQNRDGQIQMKEFSVNWSKDQVARYRRYDQNRDGVVTPKEWLIAEVSK